MQQRDAGLAQQMRVWGDTMQGKSVIERLESSTFFNK
jgi:hypothetical protein